jgi:hypothetical protein
LASENAPDLDENQRAEEERIGLDDPLDVGDGRVEMLLQRGQRDVDDRAVDEGHARRDDRRVERPPLMRACHSKSGLSS